MAEIKVGKSYKWSVEDPDSDYFVVTNVGEDTFNYTYPTWSNGAGYSSEAYYNNASLEDLVSFEPGEIELVKDVEEFKVGDYFTDTDKDIVWKVTGFPSRDEVKTKALMVTDGLDFAETVTLPREVVLSLDGATPEQIKAFENHPYWGKQEPVANAISPSVYQFPSGVEVRDISAHLTSFGGQAVQYVCRATRLDGVVKGLPVQDLKKAIQLLEWEVERLES